ncbi:MAG TPA: hypothetical protein VLB01_01770, partial [Thermodesulfobacteriota bacterium]|nr:hypothetical protein [Thermodesulfobacteriota bacterium]
MNSNSMSAAYRIFDLLVNGRRVDREAAIAALDDPAQTVDRSHLRQLILDAISQKFYPRREDLEEDEPFVWVRTWLL